MVPEPELNPPTGSGEPQPFPPPPPAPSVLGEYPPPWPPMPTASAGSAGYEPPGYPPPDYPASGWPVPGAPAPDSPAPGPTTPGYPFPGYPTPGLAAAGAVPTYPAPLAAARPEPLPSEPREYHQFYRAAAFRWWKPLIAVLLFVLLYVAAAFIFIVIPMLVWFSTITAAGGEVPTELTDFDPGMLFIANNISIVIALPIVFLAHWIVFRQRPRWLSSVAGGFRWRPFWRFLAIAALVLAMSTTAQALLSGGFGEFSWNGSSLVLIITILLTTPFQCAAEEYAMRGLVLRSVGSWFARPGLALVVGLVVNAVFFMLLHGAGDPWLNSFYLLFAALATVMVWRSGGLEAAVALHIANNMIGEALIPFQPEQLAGMFNREAGVGDPSILIQMGSLLLVGGLLLWQSSRLGMVRTAAPATATQV